MIKIVNSKSKVLLCCTREKLYEGVNQQVVTQIILRRLQYDGMWRSGILVFLVQHAGKTIFFNVRICNL